MTANFRRLAASALVLASAACADAPTAPAARTDGADFSLIGTLVRGSGDTTITEFTVDPTSSTTFQVGSGHVVYFPKYSICDLASTYGPSEWDKPCRPAYRPVTITAKTWVDGAGNPQVDFSPAMRFTSQYSDGGTVMIGMAINRVTAATAADRLKLLYCANADVACIDESLTDASLKTNVNVLGGYASRRIKHFSGYLLSSGRSEMSELSLSRSHGGDAGSVDAEPTSRTGHLMSSGRAQ